MNINQRLRQKNRVIALWHHLVEHVESESIRFEVERFLLLVYEDSLELLEHWIFRWEPDNAAVTAVEM